MRLASYMHAGEASFGLVVEDGVVDLKRRLGLDDAQGLLARGVEMAAPFQSLKADLPLRAVTLRPPIPNPTHILGIGLNTRSHFEETSTLMKRSAGDYPAKPRLFFRSPLSLVGSGDLLRIPRVSPHLDYEGEIAVVIGKTTRYVAAGQAMDHIAGFACANDGSVRDYQVHSNQVTAGKTFFASGSWGPWIVTADAVGDAADLQLETRVNGELRQQLDMDDLIFSFGELISYISEILPLQPGDVIFTGSPAGIGAMSRRWLARGDRIEVSSPQLGTLENRVDGEA